MSATPPARRRQHPVVTVRRAQSERRHLSPWQLPWRAPALGPEVLPGPPPWARVDHHHAPRTALIPPALPRLVGHSQGVLRGAGSPSGSVRHLPLPPVSGVQLPPMALGSPPLLLLPPHTFEEQLVQERLSSFLASDTLPHQPRSILSPPDSPLYESLLSIFTEYEDTITAPDTEAEEHEYQQIQVPPAPSAAGKQHQQQKQKPEQQQKQRVRKVNTLDVRPERHSHGEETSVEERCSCQSSSSSTPQQAPWDPVHPSQGAKNTSTQSVASQESHKSAIYITNTSTDSGTGTNDSDTYQESSLAPTVIHVTPVDRSSTHQKSPPASDTSKNRKTSSFKHDSSFSSSNSSSSTSTRIPLRPSYSLRSSSDDYTRVQIKVKTRPPPPDPVYPPLTIELPESKPSPRKFERSRNTKNKSTQASLSTAPHPITTLDPPLRPSRHHNTQTGFDKIPPSSASQTNSKEAPPQQLPPPPPPLIVNFDSDNESGSDSDSFSSTLAGSTTIYLADGDDTTSIYSSVAEIYSMLTSEAESLVYVYRPPPRRPRHRYSTLSYRFPTSGSSSGGSSSSSSGGGTGSSAEGTITFVEPSYRPSNLSVGSRGHLKIDYSWSWNRLDDFVRTTSPREGHWDDYHHPPQAQDTAPLPVAAPGPLLVPWERQLDLVAG